MAKETIREWKNKYSELEKEHKRVKKSLESAWHKLDSLKEGHAILINKYDFERLQRNFDDQSGELRTTQNQLRLSCKDREELLTVIKVLASAKNDQDQ